MKNITKASVAVVSAFVSASVFAESDNSTEVIVVTANNLEQQIQNTLASVSVISRADIEKLNSRDLPSLLQSITGIDLTRNGGQGQQSDAYVRGATSKHSLVIIDGVRVGDANSGSKAISNIPVNAIEKIEVIRGARAAVYGADAVAGVIHVITRQQSKSKISITGGSNGYKNTQANFGYTEGNLSLALNAGYEKTDGYDITEKQDPDTVTKDFDEDGYENKNLGVNVKYFTDDYGHFTFSSQLSRGEAEYDNAYGNDANAFDNQVSQASWHFENGRFSHQVQFGLAQDESEQFGTEFRELFKTARKEGRYQVLFSANDALQILSGLSWQQEDVTETTSLPSLTKRHTRAAFFGGFYDENNWLINATVRQDDNQSYGFNNTYNAALGYRLTDDITVRLSQGTSFKAPTFSHLYAPDSQWSSSNPDLQPEKGLSRELGLHWNFDQGSVDIAWFDNDIEQMISSVFTDGKYVPQNINAAKIKGVEVSANIVIAGIQHQINATYLNAKDASNNTNLVRRPDKSVNWTASKQWDAFQLAVGLQYRAERPTIAWFDSTLPSFTLFNVSARYHVSEQLSIFTRIENASDKYYATAAFEKDEKGNLYYYLPPQRQVYLGLDYRF